MAQAKAVMATGRAGSQRFAGGMLFLLALSVGAAAQTLPATQPTQPGSQPIQSAAGSAGAPVQPHPEAPRRARVELTGKLMKITADDSSLNQILRDVSRTLGMKISGGVTEERVYGTYGPGPSAAVLMQLLNGTGSNMLLVESGANRPQELILTPRQGGPTPPSPNAGVRDNFDRDEEDLPPQLAHHTQRTPPPAPPPADQTTPIAPARPVSDTAAASTTTTEQSPNGVKTPQQIYEQLMQLQQQRDQAKSPQQ